LFNQIKFNKLKTMNEKKIKILVIDDNENIRTLYADVFRQGGFEVSEAEDGLVGLEKATKEIPNVILTGIIMPRMDGFGLKEALGKNVSTSEIPILMLSHMGREEDRRKAQEMGIKEFFIQEMIFPKQVMEKVQNMFGLNEYKLKVNINDLDAQKLFQDLQIDPDIKCPKCGQEMVLGLKVSDSANKIFSSARFFCPNCEGIK